MYSLSKYTRVFSDIDEEIIIYNTYNKAIVSMPRKKFVEGNKKIDGLTDKEAAYLRENLFLEGTMDLQEIGKGFEKFDTLIISLELFLQCNLACPYCYQSGNTSGEKISKENMDSLFKYIQHVYLHTKFKTLIFKVLGGEPMIDWSVAEYITTKCFNFCESNGIFFKLMIDTNGTLVDSIASLSHYHTVTLTIPLTEKECHNKNRKYRNGTGTYDDIVRNTNIFSKKLKNASIVLRYNLDDENIHAFENYVSDIKGKIQFTPIISPNYTMEMGTNVFQNHLKHQEVVDWRSSTFIDVLAHNNLPIVIAPYSIESKCQYWSKYSLKMFSDGTVGPCAMSFWDTNRPSINQICDTIEKVCDFWPTAKMFNPFSNTQCQICDSLFLCGSAYNLPCSKMLGEGKCENAESFHINLKLFLSRYLKYVREGKGHLFVGFNENNNYK